jgi:P4 family phage/plasmid primase-like protien
LHFPHIRLRVADHINHLFPVLEKEINDYFRKDVFDTGIIKSSWLLYGSQKSAQREPYIVTKIYDADLNRLTPEEAFADIPILAPNGQELPRARDIAFYYPYLLSLNSQFHPVVDVQIDVMDSEFIRQITDSVFHIANKTGYVTLSPEQYVANKETVAQLLPMLSDIRASNFGDWKRVGWILFNSCGPTQDVLEMWMEFSKRTLRQNYSRQVCIDNWRHMVPGTLTIGSLKRMASADSPVAYSKFIIEHQKAQLYAALGGAHYDLALLLHDEYKDFYRCTNIAAKRWYIFENHTWRLQSDETKLRNSISTELHERFLQTRNKVASDLRAMKRDRDEEAEQDDRASYAGAAPAPRRPTEADMTGMENLMTQLSRLLKQLKTTGYKDCIMRECCELFYDETFESKLDNTPHLIAFRNGVYELKTHNFRCGKASDYISKAMPIDYIEYDPFHPEVLAVHKFLRQIFPNRSIREYFVRVNSQIFMGGNKDKKVFVWTGEGDNGKSVMCQLFEKMLGPYAQKPQTSLLTEKRGKATAADPTMARSQGARWLVFQEPSERDTINIGVLKELSGNDTFLARDLYQRGTDMREITPMFKVVLMCNKPPKLDGDKAVWNRVRVIPYESTFVTPEDLPATEEEQMLEKKFPMDPNFSENIPNMLSPFAWVLMDEFKKNGGHIGAEPFEVKNATMEYRSRNDVVQQYIREHLEPCPGVVLSLSELYPAFKSWFVNNQDKMVMNREEFLYKLTRVWGEPGRGNKWTGHRWIPEDDNGAVVTVLQDAT